MRRILFILYLLVLPTTSWADFIVPSVPDGYILDQANILSQETESQIIQIVTQIQERNSSQVVVITLPSLQWYDIAQAGIAIARDWWVGQKGSNNGALLIIAPEERKVRIEVGYGLEGAVTDAESHNIIQYYILPYFKLGDYNQGVLRGLEKLEKAIIEEEFWTPSKVQKSLREMLQEFGFLIIIFGWVFIDIIAGTKSWWFGGVAGAIFGGIIFGSLTAVGISVVIGLIFDYILSKYFYRPMKMGSGTGTRTGWFGSRGWGGGGFGWFWGGGFGGWGSGGRW